VKDLINLDGRCWNGDLLQDLFFQVDIDLICKKKPVVDMDDFWVWLHSKSGEYSVKSGYWLAFQSNKPELLFEACRQPSTNGLKEKIWSTSTSPKIKLFLWRILSVALPVADQILIRGMNVNPCCQICGQEGESINHVLFTCSVARQVWELSGVPTPEFGFQNSSIFANIQFLFELSFLARVPVQVKRSWPWVLWRLWKNRNLLLFEGISFCPLSSIVKIGDDVQEWFLAQSLIRLVDLEENNRADPCRPRWDPPPIGWVKCNVGAVWSGKKKLCGGSWVVRDDRGLVLLHSRRAFGNLTTKKDSQITCVLWAIESMDSHRLSKVLFAFEPGDLLFAFVRPKAWPSFALQVSELTHFFGKDWRLENGGGKGGFKQGGFSYSSKRGQGWKATILCCSWSSALASSVL